MKLVEAQVVGGGEDGLLVHGDNLASLGLLAPRLEGKVRLVYLDPPYNTGNRFEHYDDDVDPDVWLSIMRTLLKQIRPLLRGDGVVVAQTDRRLTAELKLLLDEVFGRKAYVTTIAVRMSATSGFKIEHTWRTIVKNTEMVHVYAGDLRLHERAYEEDVDLDPHYSLLLRQDGEAWSVSRLRDDPEVAAALSAAGTTSLAELYRRNGAFRRRVIERADFICRTHTAPGPAVAAWRAGELLAGVEPGSAQVEQRTWRGTTYWLRRTRTGVDQLIPLRLKVHQVEQAGGADRQALTNILGDWWDGFHLDMGNVDVEGGHPLKNGKKPERLLRRILRMFTLPGDLVLDPFAGSGTTAAVAHKMGRAWLGIERGEQCLTHALPRLSAVVAGQDPTGVTEATGWKGGGGFRLLRVEGRASPSPQELAEV